jgi:hypothetical protein
MKHAFALLFSLLLMLGPVVSPQAGAAAPDDGHCSMSAAAKCVRCACCIESDNTTATPKQEAVPAPESMPRWQLVASLLSVLPAVQLDALPASASVRLSLPSPQSVPLYQQHCLLLI